MEYEGAWFKEKENQMMILRFGPNPDWEKHERDQKAIEATHRGADADGGIFAYVHVRYFRGLYSRCLTHRPLKGFTWQPHVKKGGL